MSDDTERTSTGIVGFDAHLQGGYPKGKIILEGPSSEERNTFALSFAAEGLRAGDNLVVVTSSISPTKVRRELRKLGIDVKSFERKGHLVIIDWYSHSASEIFEIEEIGAVIKCPGDALHLNEAFGKAISRFPEDGRTRAVIDGLSILIGKYDMSSALLLANSIVSILGRDKSTALFVIESEMHDSATVYQLQKSFDGHIKLKRIKGEGAVVGEISVRSFKNTETPSESLLLVRSEDGALRIRSDAEPGEEELDDEISDLMVSLKKDSENAVTWFELGTHYSSDGEYEKAHECFDMAIKLQPDFLAAWTS
ncbi:MAG: ATPase domain-containing protein, partial [Thermoplasmata archaeon]